VSGPFAEAPERAALDLLRVNILALVHLTKLVRPGMLARRRGIVLNVASIAAYMPGPLVPPGLNDAEPCPLSVNNSAPLFASQTFAVLSQHREHPRLSPTASRSVVSAVRQVA
jgi:NAD(P)-dependent dehydrogenase (short-subunit alcohol dehydrogenase family)